MKTNLIGLLSLASVVIAAPLGAQSVEDSAFTFPSGEAGLRGSALYTPVHPSLVLARALPARRCPDLHPSLAGDLSERRGLRAAKRESIKRVQEGSLHELADARTSAALTAGGLPLAFLLLLAGRCGRRRDKILIR